MHLQVFEGADTRIITGADRSWVHGAGAASLADLLDQLQGVRASAVGVGHGGWRRVRAEDGVQAAEVGGDDIYLVTRLTFEIQAGSIA